MERRGGWDGERKEWGEGEGEEEGRERGREKDSAAHRPSKQVISSAQIQRVEKETPSLDGKSFTVTLRGHGCKEGQN